VGVQPFYNSTSFLDDLAWGGAWLYEATGNETYLQQAVAYYVRFATTSQYRGFRFS